MATNEEKKSWHSQIYNNWVTTVIGLVMLVSIFAGWANGMMSVPGDIRELKETQKTFAPSATVVALETRVSILEGDNVKNRELLIRMDERLKSIQERLGVREKDQTK